MNIPSSLLPKISTLPQTPGVYLFKNLAGEILYVGKANELRSRVRAYFAGTDTRPKVPVMITQITDLETIEVGSEFEALLLEAALIKKHLPKYNTVAKDDKHPLYIAITKEAFPKVNLIRRSQEIGPAYVFGPFPSSNTVRQVLKFLRKVFPYCSCKHNRGRPCLYAAIGLCHPSPRRIMHQSEPDHTRLKTQYRRQLHWLVRLLSGDAPQVIRSLEREMARMVRQQNYEQAAAYRDGLAYLRQLLQPQHSPHQYLDNPNLRLEIKQQAVKELAQTLNQQGIDPAIKQLSRIEGYDISTLSGKFSTGALVVFTDGVPDKSQYRRFKIKVEGKPDDVGMMREMLERRFSRLSSAPHQVCDSIENTNRDHTPGVRQMASSWPLPDLIVVDGGLPQLHTALSVLKSHQLHIPLISLAKREEEIYLSRQTAGQTLRLPRHSSALQILQHLRDEAHRFANRYRKQLAKLSTPRVV